jgi:hypothetical protein
MRLLSLDFDPVYGEDATRAGFSSEYSAFDYDVVIWNPSQSLPSYKLDSLYILQDSRQLTESSSARLKADVKRRHDEFTEFLNLGRTLIIIASPPQKIRLSNRSEVDLLDAIPSDDSRFTSASGTRIDFTGNGSVVDFLRKYRDRLSYAAVIANPPGTPYARIVGTELAIGSIQRFKSGGHMVIIPCVDLSAPYDEESDEEPSEDDRWIPEAEQFQADLFAAVEQLNGSAFASRPSWADDYATKEQAALRADSVKAEEELESARVRLADAHRQKELSELRNQLFLGTGRALELEVRKVFELLGCEVTEPVPGRDDWKVSFPEEGRAVCEVKGVAKSGAEKHAAQLEKWVSSDYAETGEQPKGILVVNAWRDVPPADRTEANFPDQMLNYSISRGHCLISGLQLFVILNDVEANPDRADHWRKAIISTNGVITGCDDWRSVLSASPNDA